MRWSSIACLTACLALGGCVDGPPEVSSCLDDDTQPPDAPLVRTTAHLDIYSDSFVCAGTAVELERHVDFIGAQLGLELRTNIPVYLLPGKPDECPAGAYGCFTHGIAFAPTWTAYHELGHAVSCQLRSRSRAVFMEGLAVMFEPQPKTVALDDGYDLFGLLTAEHARELNYGHAGHFARWLVERDGMDAFAELYLRAGTLGETLEALELIYGASLDELEVEYHATAPKRWVPFRQCADLPQLEPDDDGVWRHAAMVDCEHESTMGPYVRVDPSFAGDASTTMYQSFTFTVDEPITLDYEIVGDVDYVQLERCMDESQQEVDELGPKLYMPPTGSVFGETYLSLEPGVWRADVLLRHGSPRAFGLSFWAEANG